MKHKGLPKFEIIHLSHINEGSLLNNNVISSDRRRQAIYTSSGGMNPKESALQQHPDYGLNAVSETLQNVLTQFKGTDPPQIPLFGLA